VIGANSFKNNFFRNEIETGYKGGGRGRDKKSIQKFGQETLRNRRHARHKYRWENNIVMCRDDLQDGFWMDDWIY
jgi:hypothetical protein